MSNNEQIENDIDDTLCSIYDLHDSDDLYVQLLLEYCHEHKKEIAIWIKNR
jgi:hypothetical protein